MPTHLPLLRARAGLPWPLPAVLAWAAGWATWIGAGATNLPPLISFTIAALASGGLAWRQTDPWRRGIAAAGFPLSAWVLGAAAGLPAWLWLLLLLPVLATYPLRAWRDAPFFPTPHAALQGLDQLMDTPRRVLDAGCGLGHGLIALRALWPQAELQGLEWSRLLAAAAAWRCRREGLQARVRRGDMWATSWATYDLVYLFQRPESMARAWAKACGELAPGGWLVSLEFAVPQQDPTACIEGPGRRPVWIYRVPQPADTESTRSTDAARGR